MKKTSPETREVNWPFEDEINASGLLSVRDYGNASLIGNRTRVRTSFWIAALPLLMLVELFGILFIRDGLLWEGALFTVLPILAAYFVLIHPYLCSWHLVRKFRSSEMDPGEWTFSRQGIRYENGESDTHMKWRFVKQAIITNRYVLLYLERKRCHLFASPMFDTPTDWRNFRIGIIRNFVGCRGCKYDLHGTISDTCPECGEPIDSTSS